MKTYILDANAVIAYFRKENGTDVINEIIKQATYDINSKIYMHRINLLEVYYITAKGDGVEKARDVLKYVREMPISVVDGLRSEVFEKAGYFKSTYKMSLADSVLLAESVARDCTVITSDHHEFDIVEQSENIRFTWFK